jgi:hypothetical protein
VFCLGCHILSFLFAKEGHFAILFHSQLLHFRGVSADQIRACELEMSEHFPLPLNLLRLPVCAPHLVRLDEVSAEQRIPLDLSVLQQTDTAFVEAANRLRLHPIRLQLAVLVLLALGEIHQRLAVCARELRAPVLPRIFRRPEAAVQPPHNLALQHFPIVLPELNARRIDRIRKLLACPVVAHKQSIDPLINHFCNCVRIIACASESAVASTVVDEDQPPARAAASTYAAHAADQTSPAGIRSVAKAVQDAAQGQSPQASSPSEDAHASLTAPDDARRPQQHLEEVDRHSIATGWHLDDQHRAEANGSL